VDACPLIPVIDADRAGELDEVMETTAATQTFLPVTPSFLDTPDATGRRETIMALGAAALHLDGHRYDEALVELAGVNVPMFSAPDLALQVLNTEGWARLYLGQLDAATAICERARSLAEGPSFSELDRADSLFRLGACRVKLGEVSNAISLFTLALRLAEQCGIDGDRVRAQAFEWRARCYVLQREWDAAQVDSERALELAEAVSDLRLAALATMQCSLVAERRGDPLLARFYAERARAMALASGDRQTEARLLNNLGGLSFLLDEPHNAVAYLKDAFALSLEIGNDADAAQAISSLAQVHLRCGAPLLAEEQARHALSLLEGREDYLDERGNVHLVLGRALLEQERMSDAMSQFAAAEWLFTKLGSASPLAAAWMAQAEAYAHDGDLEAAIALYRRAAEALQDFSF
jgi:tetratricopeptide (TPR) repeat protein